MPRAPAPQKRRRRDDRTESPRRSPLRTVRVPERVEPVFLRAQDYVSRYFQSKVENPELGTISISGERYVLLRAASMSVEFFDLVMSLYRDKGSEEARSVASNLLFDIAHAIGKADARTFHQRMGAASPIEKLSAGPIHFSFAGWAFVDIFPESNPAPGPDFFLIYDHPYSFESDAWLKRGRQSEFPVCVMNAGYSSGWCEESFGLALVAAEIECLAAGGRHCRFVMAPPAHIEEHLARYTRRKTDRPSRAGLRGGSTPVNVPEFFQRKRMEDELRRSYEGLERAVAERTVELRAANEQLLKEIAERRRAEEVRDEFLQVAAHELKTPMTSLRGFAQVLLRQIERDEAPDAVRLRQALQAIDDQSEKLSRLVGQLLDVARLEAGRLFLERKVTDVVGLVEGAVAAARARATGHAVRFEAPSSALALVDPLRLEQVITNLVDNAVKYSPEGGDVEVQVAKSGGEVRLTVVDRGLGVPPEHRQHIFDRFYQAHAEHRLGGMGLGLYISRQIVELHGGTIEAEFPAAGGTRVLVRLPVGRK